MREQPLILIVDDSQDNRLILEARLASLDYATAMAADGQEAIRLTKELLPDLVLLDWMMPGLDGLEVCKRLRADADLPFIPIILVTAKSAVQDVVEGLAAGADDYVTKPVEHAALVARVRAMLRIKRLHDELQASALEIERQRARADQLLHAILPAPAVAELQATGRVQPRRHQDVAVLFCDVSGFTAFCDAHPPERVVAALEHLVQAFEASSERHGLEKLKTVGDALIATGDLLADHDDAVAAALACAFELMQAARQGPAGWELHCGLHIGPVVSGVLGTTKLAFDLWGDTVNTAARLASLPGTGCVHLSEPAWLRIQGRLAGEPLGHVPLRGKGDTLVWRCMPEGRA